MKQESRSWTGKGQSISEWDNVEKAGRINEERELDSE